MCKIAQNSHWSILAALFHFGKFQKVLFFIENKDKNVFFQKLHYFYVPVTLQRFSNCEFMQLITYQIFLCILYNGMQYDEKVCNTEQIIENMIKYFAHKYEQWELLKSENFPGVVY